MGLAKGAVSLVFWGRQTGQAGQLVWLVLSLLAACSGLAGKAFVMSQRLSYQQLPFVRLSVGSEEAPKKVVGILFGVSPPWLQEATGSGA